MMLPPGSGGSTRHSQSPMLAKVHSGDEIIMPQREVS
jgi:hypothetical protein